VKFIFTDYLPDYQQWVILFLRMSVPAYWLPKRAGTETAIPAVRLHVSAPIQLLKAGHLFITPALTATTHTRIADAVVFVAHKDWCKSKSALVNWSVIRKDLWFVAALYPNNANALTEEYPITGNKFTTLVS
jgi:hypothetical protein